MVDNVIHIQDNRTDEEKQEAAEPQSREMEALEQMKVIIDKNGDVKKTALNWLFTRAPETTALYLILIVIVVGSYRAATVWIPAHLQSIHTGYKEISTENRAAHEKIAEQHSKDVDKLSNSFEKMLDRYDNWQKDAVRTGRQ